MRIIPSLLAVALLSACVYRLDIQQGNYLDEKLTAMVNPGMTREQVRFILGTPQLQHPFDPNRWDYLYYRDSKNDERDEVRRLTVFFEDDTVSRVENRTPEIAGVNPRSRDKAESASDANAG